ncbi:hypothetical protein SNOG_12585 [Parastagonospora nodorum SN15]|uniref:Uncharacterized protein n=1 Tax=Phaeosphaeria nodorum (strain SN15 / ATCC MYA-4574 / FGSC 10173) TaxID=321614 RepID=Q0U6M9_PHANO|nr:hypothetical protein SNOG_12585 [Parastagonospora nodorum SN15]EAT79883.2 hypothetical protein SNOG_12585 [Parastagonospora nodorum SN15]
MDDEFNLQGMNGPFHIDAPQAREHPQSSGLTNEFIRAPRKQLAQKIRAVVKKEKEVAQLDAEDSPSYIRQGHFRLMDLPAELRVYIYESLLPHNSIISFDRKASPPYLSRKAILYGSNTYLFTINSHPHQPSSLRSPQIFGAFGYNDRQLLLRNLRSITVDVSINDSSHWDVKRLRTRLDYFVEVLKQHADDANQSSLLTQLTVYMADRSHLHWRMRNVGPPMASERPEIDKYMFGLESLVGLTGIKDVTVGGVPEWYAKCLQLCVQGRGGEVKETEWPLVKVKHAKKKKVKWVSTRQWWQPVWNWKEFAERNGVEMPENVDKYWMDQP